MSEKFLKTIHFDKASGTYNVQLPWKSNKQELPTNFELSKRRLKSLIFTLKTKDPALISKYNSQLMEELDLGFIEKVQEPTNATVIHYIPHFPVFKDSATTKMRIVYDASAKTSPSALCLNDCLYTGPNLIQNLSSILIKFRKHKVAFVADIEKAFLQIALYQNDRDATRFLWFKDINKSFDDDNIQTFRFLSKTCKITLWSDSQIVLSWLTTKKQLQQYVCSRVEKINQITSSHTWKYCPTSENPADLLTRGLSTAQLNENLQLWLHGPPWLTKSEQEWPTKEPNCTAEDLDVIVNTTTLTQKEETNDTPSILNIIHLERYSSWSKVLRVTALVIRAHKIWKKKTISQNLTATDISEAETILIKATQQKRFAKEITHLKIKTKSKSPALISQLQLYLDKNDIIRCRGRIDHSELSMDTKFPILLPKADHLTTLIVRARHASVLHGGVAQTLTDLRQRYWIPQGRLSITKIISKCLICKKAEGRAFSSQPTPPLPKARVTQSRVFQFVGVDYAGPLYVRNQDNRSSKVYICLFTCASTRALHLEIAEDMTTKAFLGGFRRFISRRGIPESNLSDNAKTFKVGAKTLKSIATQLIEKPESQKFLSDHGINWHFIPEAAPWWGGFYERMVGLVKRPLKKVIGRACLNVIELSTILTEVEAVLNSRPLTYTYVNTKKEGPLTPAHFLCGHRLLSLPDQQNSNEDYGNTTREELSRRAKYHETLIHSFWKRWQQEYLTGLREQYCKKRKAPNYTVSKGDVVLIHDHIRKRNQWKMGVVTTLVVE